MQNDNNPTPVVEYNRSGIATLAETAVFWRIEDAPFIGDETGLALAVRQWPVGDTGGPKRGTTVF